MGLRLEASLVMMKSMGKCIAVAKRSKEMIMKYLDKKNRVYILLGCKVNFSKCLYYP